MSAYATVADVQARMTREMTQAEQNVCSALLDDAAVIIDTKAADADAAVKKIVSCRMVMRAIGDGETSGIPVGASSGSMSGLGYSQSWSLGSNGSALELYLSKIERQMLGLGNLIGTYSPTQALVKEVQE